MKSKTYAQKKLSKIDVDAVIGEEFESLLSKLKKELQKFKDINVCILFGSFARGDYSSRDSDIDIMLFLDKEEKDPNLEERILKKVISFNLGKQLSIHTIFQYKKLDEEDRSLMHTIADEGKILFARKAIVISKDILGLKSSFLIKFDTANVDPVTKNKLQRFLYGYTVKGKKYKGIVDGDNVISAGKGAIILPQELLKKVMLVVQKIGISAVQKAKLYR